MRPEYNSSSIENIDVIEAEDAGTPPRPEQLNLDRGYDVCPLRMRPVGRGIETILPHCGYRKLPRTQDVWMLSRLRRLCEVDQPFA
ncbi:hypothetical protein EP7_001949 [Isosphaeraceae bacterium EP7]